MAKHVTSRSARLTTSCEPPRYPTMTPRGAFSRKVYPTPPLTEAESVERKVDCITSTRLELHRRRPRNGLADVPC
jgi:hypothetical protein